MARLVWVVPALLLFCWLGPLHGRPAGLEELRPGASLLDRLELGVLEEYPETNLPPEILALARDAVRMRASLGPADWLRAGPIPDEYRSALAATARPAGDGVVYWRADLRLPPSPSGRPPRLLVAGVVVEAFDPSRSLFSGSALWYDASERVIFALTAAPVEGTPPMPADVEVEYWADPVVQLGRYERRLGALPAAPLPSARSLLTREEIGAQSRPCLLLPAPGSLAFAFDSFPADALQLAVGYQDRSYRIVEGRLGEAEKLSDGVEFSVEVESAAGRETVWQHDKSFPEFEEVTVDLRRYRGESIRLRLRSRPRGEPHFDYALWSDLRLLAAPARSPDRPHVVVIDIDTLRADRLGSYGYARPTSPQLDAWAAGNAAVFRNATAASSWTLPSTASLLTGLAVHQHRVRDHTHSLTNRTATVAKLLRESGYETYGFTASGFFQARYGFDLGFDLHDGSVDYVGAERAFSDALERLRSRRSERPVFLFLHTYWTHAPWRPDPQFQDASYRGPLAGHEVNYRNVINPVMRGELELAPADRDYVNALYDASIRRLDALLGRLLAKLDVVLGGEDALVILTSDHGEEFWEHGSMSHGKTLYDEQLRIPLIVRFPGQAGKRRVGVSDAPVSLLDVLPTILDVAGVEAPDGLPGLSLGGRIPEQRVRVAQLDPEHQAISLGSEKLILRDGGASLELFLLDRDPVERENVAAQRVSTVKRLRGQLERYVERHPVVEDAPALHPRDAGEIEALRALGYVE